MAMQRQSSPSGMHMHGHHRFLMMIILLPLLLLLISFASSSSAARFPIPKPYDIKNPNSCDTFLNKNSRSLCIQLQINHHHQHHSPPPPPPLGHDQIVDPRYGVEKRLVPTGPNPLHNWWLSPFFNLSFLSHIFFHLPARGIFLVRETFGCSLFFRNSWGYMMSWSLFSTYEVLPRCYCLIKCYVFNLFFILYLWLIGCKLSGCYFHACFGINGSCSLGGN